MTLQPMNELFAPYTSNWLRTQLSTTHLLLGSTWHMSATVLYADLRNFSRLSAIFAQRVDGAERLHETLTLLYSTLITVIMAHHGDVVSIAGDALTVWWPDCFERERGQQCGQAMLAALSVLPPIHTPEGPFQLDLRIGVATDCIEVALVGRPPYGVHLALYGPAIEAAIKAKSTANTGEMRVAATNQVQSKSAFMPIASHSTAGPNCLQATGATPTDRTQELLALEHFLPPSFVERLRIGVLLAEYRRCVPAFAAFQLPATAATFHDLVVRVQVIVARWGGWLNEVEIGDKGPVFVLLFGAPITHGDDPFRAVGCCLELQARGLITHVGITVGTLFVGSVGCAIRRVYTVQGAEMNLAAHLMEAAAPDAILISGRIRNEVAAQYTFSSVFRLAVKGHTEPVPVARVSTTVQRYGRLNDSVRQRYLPEAVPLIGRHAERAVLKQAIEQAIAGQVQIIFVEGESGIGKSSLLQDSMRQWLHLGLPGYSAECRNNGQEHTGLPWKSILCDLWGIDEAVPLSQQQSRLEALLNDVQTAFSSTAQPGEWVWKAPSTLDALHLLVQLLEGVSVFQHDSLSTPVCHATLQTQIIALVSALLHRRLQQSPLLIMLENIHWADDFSLRLATNLAWMSHTFPDRPYPLLLVVSSRLLDHEPPSAVRELLAHPGCRRLKLGPLTTAESQALLQVLLGTRNISAALNRLIERQAQGQPLFIKECLRALHQQRLLRYEQGVVSLTDENVELHLSPTVQGIIQAWVDRLDESTRLTLKTAAVIGYTFPLTLLASIHPAHLDNTEVQAQLEHLVRLNMLELEQDGVERVYRFKHHSTHEVAYHSLLFSQRRSLHTAIAHWYEMMFRIQLRTNQMAMIAYRLLAYHYGRAESTAAQAYYCHAAGRQAALQYANLPALEYLGTALALPRDLVQRYDLLWWRAIIYGRLGEYTAQLSDIRSLSVLAIMLEDDQRQFYADICMMRYLLHRGEYATVIRQAARMHQRIAGISAGPRAWCKRRLAVLLRAIWLDIEGQAHMGLGSTLTARRCFGRAYALCEWLRHRPLSVTTRLCYRRPVVSRSSAGQRPALTTVYADPRLLATQCLQHLGAAYLLLNDPAQARRCAQHACDRARTTGDWSGESYALILLSQVCYAEGRYLTAQEHAARALVISCVTGERIAQAHALQQLARIRTAPGDHSATQGHTILAMMINSLMSLHFLHTLMLKNLGDMQLIFTAQAIATARAGCKES